MCVCLCVHASARVCDWVIMCLIACWSGLVYSFCAILDLLISLCLLATRCVDPSFSSLRVCVCVCWCASQPTFFSFFGGRGGLHSLFFCHFQSCRTVSKDCLVLCLSVCVCVRTLSFWCTTQARGQLGWRDGKRSPREGEEKGWAREEIVVCCLAFQRSFMI